MNVEVFDYIKETGVQIKELQDKVIELTEANKKSEIEVERLKGMLDKKNYQVQSLSHLCNEWHAEYESMATKYTNLEAQNDFVSLALARVCNELKEKIDEDIAEDIFSEILNNFKRSRW